MDYKNGDASPSKSNFTVSDYDLQLPAWSLECLKTAAIQQRLQRPLSLAWAILLNALPPPNADIAGSLKTHRNFYNDLQEKLSMDPRNVIGDDPLSQNDESAWNQHFCDNELKALILQDVVRTFPDELYFRDKDVQDMMVQVLFFWARSHGHVGYRQGMHEVLAPLLLELHRDRKYSPRDVSNTLKYILEEEYLEHDSYMLFSAVMKGLEKFYTTGDVVPSSCGRLPVSKVVHNPNEVVRYLDKVREECLTPLDNELATHLVQCNISMELFGIRWLRLLFGREFPRVELPHLWGFLFADGPMLPNIHYVIVAVLIAMRGSLLDPDPGVVLSALMRPPRLSAPYACALALHLRRPLEYPRPVPPPADEKQDDEWALEQQGFTHRDSDSGSEGVAEGADIARSLAALGLLRAQLPAAARALARELPDPPPSVAAPLHRILKVSAHSLLAALGLLRAQLPAAARALARELPDPPPSVAAPLHRILKVSAHSLLAALGLLRAQLPAAARALARELPDPPPSVAAPLHRILKVSAHSLLAALGLLRAQLPAAARALARELPDPPPSVAAPLHRILKVSAHSLLAALGLLRAQLPAAARALARELPDPPPSVAAPLHRILKVSAHSLLAALGLLRAQLPAAARALARELPDPPPSVAAPLHRILKVSAHSLLAALGLLRAQLPAAARALARELPDPPPSVAAPLHRILKVSAHSLLAALGLLRAQLPAAARALARELPDPPPSVAAPLHRILKVSAHSLLAALGLLRAQLPAAARALARELPDPPPSVAAPLHRILKVSAHSLLAALGLLRAQLPAAARALARELPDPPPSVAAPLHRILKVSAHSLLAALGLLRAQLPAAARALARELPDPPPSVAAPLHRILKVSAHSLLAALGLLRAQLPAAARALARELPDPPPSVAAPLHRILKLAALLECRNHALIDVETALEAAEGAAVERVGRRQLVPVIVSHKPREPKPINKVKEVPLKLFHRTECTSSDLPCLDPLRLRTE